MALGAQIVHLVRLHLLHDPDEIGGVGQIAIVEYELLIVYMRILIQMIHPLGIKEGGAAFDAVYLIAFFQ